MLGGGGESVGLDGGEGLSRIARVPGWGGGARRRNRREQWLIFTGENEGGGTAAGDETAVVGGEGTGEVGDGCGGGIGFGGGEDAEGIEGGVGMETVFLGTYDEGRTDDA